MPKYLVTKEVEAPNISRIIKIEEEDLGGRVVVISEIIEDKKKDE